MDWLTASGDCEIEEDDRSVSVTCRQNQARLKIVASPGHDELIVKPHRPFSLEVDDGVEIADDFRLVIIPQTRRSGICTIRAQIAQIRCDGTVVYPMAGNPALGLAHSADVEFAGGNWTLDAAYNADRVPVNVVADASDDAQTRLTCRLPIGSLTSAGDHSFSLRWAEGATIKIAAGSPTFETPLHRVSLSGTGDVVVNGDITDSTVDLSGSLRANGDVTGTAIDIDGALTVSGRIVLDTHELTCGTAHISGGLDSRSTVRASSLTVEGGIAGTSEIETHDLSCDGPLSAGKVTATGTARIYGNAQCEEMRCEGDIELRGEMAKLERLRWVVPDGERRMSVQHADDELASAFMRMPEVTVAELGEGVAAPTLDLGLNIGIENLRVSVPRISISVDSIPKGATVDFAKEVVPCAGLTLERRDVEMCLHSGSLVCSLPGGKQQPFSVNCDPGSTLALSKLNEPLPELRVQGGGHVSIEDPGPGASLGTVHIVGSTTLACAAPISKLRMEPGLSEEGLCFPVSKYTVPRINLAADVVVREASGGCVLEHLGARIRGVERPRKRHGTSQLTVYDITTRLGVTESAGHLTDVDVSHLDADKIDYLTEPRVLEISGRTVRCAANERTPLRCLPSQILQALVRTVERFTGERARSRLLRFLALRLPQAKSSLSRDEIRERAERIARLSDVVGRRVNSGNSRAWLNWSIARLQHRGLRLFAFERLFRSAFRMVGYGYRPGPAFLTWIATAATGLVYAWWNGDPANANPKLDPIAFDWPMLAKLGEFMFLPIGYLRLASASDTLVLTPTIADIGIRVLIGVPFLFLLLSLRQFFRSRASKGE